jgi:hypothetical protein
MADEVAELQLFVEIVKAGNLSAAARALNSSPAAMSRGLTALESRLGVRLVTRTSRTFELTAEGHLFYERCERIVAEIAEAEAEASSQGKTVKGKLRIGAPMGIGRRLIAPLVAGFVERYPGIQVHLNLSDSGLDVIDEIDLFAICASRQHLFPRIRVFLDFISSTLPKMVSQESRTNLPQSTSKDVPPVTKPRRSPRPDSNRDRLH